MRAEGNERAGSPGRWSAPEWGDRGSITGTAAGFSQHHSDGSSVISPERNGTFILHVSATY